MAKYDVLEACDLDELIEEVNEQMKAGWMPLGGFVIQHYKWTNERKGYKEAITWFYQTMLLDTERE